MTTNTTQGQMVQGRIVWTLGQSVFEGKKLTDFNTGAPILDENGESIVEFGFGLAVPKVDPSTGQFTQQFTALWNAIHSEALTLYPNGQVPKDFAYKFKDGDTDLDDKGVPYSKREGYAGHLVLACTTRIAPKFFKWEGGNNILVASGIKCGDYVNVQLNLKAHPPKGRGKPGLYTNPSAVQLIQPGKEIINQPSGDQLFGMQAPVYQGAVEAPAAPTMPQYQPQVPQAPQMPQQPAYAPPAAPQYDPHYGVLPPQHQPQAPQMPPMPGMPR